MTRDADDPPEGQSDGPAADAPAESVADDHPEGTATSPETPASPPNDDAVAVGSGWNDEGARGSDDVDPPSLGDAVDPRAVTRAVVASLGLGLFGLGVGLGLAFGAMFLFASLGVDLTPLVVLVTSLVLVQGVAFGGVALGYLRVRDRPLSAVGLRTPGLRDLLVAVAGYAIALTLAIGGALFVTQLGLETGTNQAAELASRDPTVLLLMIPASFVFIGPGEELLFRGVVQGRLRETLPAPAAIALASAFFAGVHVVAITGGMNARLVAVAVLFGPALVFGTAYELTDNLVVPSLIHGAYNATLFTLLYVALRFGGAGGSGAVVL